MAIDYNEIGKALNDTIKDQVERGNKLEEVFDATIKGIQILEYYEYLDLDIDIMKINNHQYMIVKYKEDETIDGNACKKVYDITNKNNPLYIGRIRIEDFDRSIFDMITKFTASSDKKKMEEWEEEIRKFLVDNGEPTN